MCWILKVFFKRREGFFQVGFLEELKTTSICIKFRKNYLWIFIFMKVARIQMIHLLKHFSFYYYHNWRYSNCRRASYISLWLHSVKYTKIREDLENINVGESRRESWGRSKTSSLRYIVKYLFALAKEIGRNPSADAYKGLPQNLKWRKYFTQKFLPAKVSSLKVVFLFFAFFDINLLALINIVLSFLLIAHHRIGLV